MSRELTESDLETWDFSVDKVETKYYERVCEREDEDEDEDADADEDASEDTSEDANANADANAREDDGEKTPWVVAPSYRWVAAYWDQVDVRSGDTFGEFFRLNQGPSTWVLTNEPRTGDDCLWTVPYAGTRYAYRFHSYKWAVGGCCDFGQTPYHGKLRECGFPRPGGTLTHTHVGTDCLTVLQTDSLLPGWDMQTDMLDERENDDWGGVLDLIDFGDPSPETPYE
jgi:hypothetical protein